MGLLGAAFGVGFVAGPAIGALGALGGAHVPFFVAAAIAFVNGLVAIRRLPETHPSKTDPVDDTGRGSRARRRAAGGRAGARRSGAGRGRARAATRRTGEMTEADRHIVLRLITVAFAGMVAFSGFEATFALLTDRRFDLSCRATAAVFTVIGLALVVVQVGLVGPVTTRLGEGARCGSRCWPTRSVWSCSPSTRAGWGWSSRLALLVLGQGLITPTLSSAVAGRAGRDRGQWLGWQQSAGGLARVLGPAVGGALFQHVGVGAPYVAGAVCRARSRSPSVPGLPNGWRRGRRPGTVDVTGG